eukprot:TRINITY_DN12975_c0_g1_i1.p1 TRINITY_DN12975_c0_g1~~TRINITY_DN12975_c0_g1_i1.p1  ORF type:complete len:897 (+),score=237.17 TRINITY_DN12975_c0_g1_i1:334-3024(+)
MKKKHAPTHKLKDPDSYRMREDEYMDIVWNHKINKCKKGCYYQQERIVCPNYHDEDDRRRSPRRKLASGELSNQAPWSYQSVACNNVIETMYYPTNFKTKNCTFFAEDGSCHIGKVCSFRHVYKGTDYDSLCNMFNRPLVISEDRYRYMAFEYKTERCKIPSHPPPDLRVPWWNCPYWHDENDRRLLTETHRDVDVPPEHSENITTRFCHPMTLMTRMCKEEKKCNHPYCRFAHSEEEVEMVEKYRLKLSQEQSEERRNKANSNGISPPKPNSLPLSPQISLRSSKEDSPLIASNGKIQNGWKEDTFVAREGEDYDVQHKMQDFTMRSSNDSYLSPDSVLKALSESDYEEHPYLSSLSLDFDPLTYDSFTSSVLPPSPKKNVFHEVRDNENGWSPTLSECQQINQTRFYVNLNHNIGERGSNVYLGLIRGSSPLTQVAVKIIPERNYSNGFHEVAGFLEQIDHPNFVRCHSSGRLDGPTAERLNVIKGSRYIVMELFGSSMFKVLERLFDQENSNFMNFYYKDRNGSIHPTPKTIEICKEVLRGVAYMQYHNIQHKDIKPTSILIDVDSLTGNGDSPKVKLCDVGSSQDGTVPPIGFSNTVMGTHAWQPPEVVFNSRGSNGGYSPSNGVYSAALCIYFLLTLGKHPLLDSEDGTFFPSWYDAGISIPENTITANIHQTKKGNFQVKCDALNHIPVAKHLLISMMGGPFLDPTKRISASQALNHPFFWSPSESMKFIQLFDTVLNRPNPNLELIRMVESLSHHVLLQNPNGPSWFPMMSNSNDAWTNLVKRCNESMMIICGGGYNFSSVSSLVNMIKNLLACMNKPNIADTFFGRDIYNLIGKTTLEAVASIFLPKFPLLISGLHLAYGRFKDHDEHFFELINFVKTREQLEQNSIM